MKRSIFCRLLLLTAIALVMLSVPTMAEEQNGETAGKLQIDSLQGYIHYRGGLDPCGCGITGYMTQDTSASSPRIANLSGLNIGDYVNYMGKRAKVIGQWVDCVECSAFSVVSIRSGYIQGDANDDGVFDISDCVYLLYYIFSNGPAPVVMAAGDIDCSGGIDVSDVVYMIGRIFAGVPFPDCP
jgi:hypothetical protein